MGSPFYGACFSRNLIASSETIFNSEKMKLKTAKTIIRIVNGSLTGSIKIVVIINLRFRVVRSRSSGQLCVDFIGSPRSMLLRWRGWECLPRLHLRLGDMLHDNHVPKKYRVKFLLILPC